jgi:hypothetical protein
MLMGRMGYEIARMVLVSYYFGCMEDIVLLAAMLMTTNGGTITKFISTSPNA